MCRGVHSLLSHPYLATDELQGRPAVDERVPGKRSLTPRTLPLTTSAHRVCICSACSGRLGPAGEQTGGVLADSLDVAFDEVALRAILLLVTEQSRAAAVAWIGGPAAVRDDVGVR